MSPSIQSAADMLRRIPVDLVTTYELSVYLRCNRKSIERLVARGVLKPISHRPELALQPRPKSSPR